MKYSKLKTAVKSVTTLTTTGAAATAGLLAGLQGQGRFAAIIPLFLTIVKAIENLRKNGNGAGKPPLWFWPWSNREGK
jgi:hypothetical protein